MKKTLASVALALVVLVIASAGLFWLIPGVQDWLLLQGASRRIRNTDTILPSTDGIRIILCGTSPPRPSKTRAKSCAAVIAGNRIFIVDTGPGLGKQSQPLAFSDGTYFCDSTYPFSLRPYR